MAIAQPVANVTEQQDYNTARNTYNQAAGAALPSQASLDNAAARVRARLAGQAAGQRKSIQQNLAGRGIANSGIARNINSIQSANEQAALGGALSDLQGQWWDKQQEGANILSNIGQSQTGLGNSINEAMARNQSISNDWTLGQDKLEEEKRKNIYDTLLGLSSIFGQYGNTQFTGERSNQWEALLNNLSGVAGYTPPKDSTIDLSSILPNGYPGAGLYSNKFTGSQADWNTLMSKLSNESHRPGSSMTSDIYNQLVQLGSKYF